ncbi:MAG: type II secretion system protein M [Candidatus Accumulibacter sp.]|jgi:type II secretory pathway component PulM|nr:type II secretion system protein M [Accumulibacter sp.]
MRIEGRIVPIERKSWSWWRERSERERRILALWLAAVALLALWFGVCAPLFQRINALEKRVPELEMLLNRMRAQPTAGKSAAGAVARPSGEDLRSALYGLLAEIQVSAELRALSPTRVEMRLPEMPMKDALETLDALRQRTGARVAVFSARSDGSAGANARVVVELERNP